MKKNDNLENYDVIIPTNNKKSKTSSRNNTSKKNAIIEDDGELTTSKKKTTRQTKSSRSTKKEPIIEDAGELSKPKVRSTRTKTNKSVVIEEDSDISLESNYSRVAKRTSTKKKDRRLETLINEINSNDEEFLDESLNKKEEKDKEEELLVNKNEEEENFLLNQETKVLSRITSEDLRREDNQDILLEKHDIKLEKPIVNAEAKKVVKKKKKYRIKKRAIFVLLIILLLIGGGIAFISHKKHIKKLEEEEKIRIENQIKDIKEHFSAKVIVNNDALIYKKVNDNYQTYGTIYKDNVISLSEQEINEDTEYFYNKELDAYIKYSDVTPTDKEIVKDDRYKKYIPFNENAITNSEYTIYHGDGSKMYKLSNASEYPIIIKDTDKYYFEYQDELVYILKSETAELKKNENTKLKNVESIPVLNYHFIYDPKERSCNQSICLTVARFEEHLKYFKDSNILDLTMKEFEMYMDKKINLPKSVLITLDDGWLRQKGVEILDKHEMHATYFLITSEYQPIESKYVEFHSHTHNMHQQGQCKTGQGGGIQCLSEAKIQEDLKKSREILNNTTYFCFPFYEWNDYAIGQLKKAGFTLAFIGGQRSAKPSDNHYRIPRYIIYNWTTVNNIKQYFN